MNNQHHSIAVTFAELLADEIGKEQYRIVVNRNDPDSSVCLSHDYCDANMIMLAAVESHGFSVFDEQDMNDSIATLWNGAWNIFKQLGPDLLG